MGKVVFVICLAVFVIANYVFAMIDKPLSHHISNCDHNSHKSNSQQNVKSDYANKCVGPPGPKGEPGETSQCRCNFDLVYALQEQVRILTASCFGGLILKGQCIRLPYTQGLGVEYEEAKNVCQNLNSTLFELTDDTAYKHVTTYIWATWIQYTDEDWHLVDVWLGSTFETSGNPNNLITLKNGTRKETQHWYPSYPRLGTHHATRTNLLLSVRKHSHDSKSGIWNFPPYASAVPLCVYNI